jgi:4-amino-4-deoxy-L-arabinose transferase-like glycosyltransferase
MAGPWGATALAAAIALRAWWIYKYGLVTGDTVVYGDIAQNWMRHGIYGLTGDIGGHPFIRPTLIRLPGYPLLLVACFALFGAGKYTAVLLLQAALDLWTCLLLAGTARRLFGEPAGLAALWLAALCPFMANMVASPLTETPTLFCIALAFYAMVRWVQCGCRLNRWIAALGFALAWAILLRPEQGLLAAAIVPAILWSDRQMLGPSRPWSFDIVRAALLLSSLAVLPLVPWTARNWHTFHVVQPLAPRYANDPGEFNPYGFQRWYRTWAIDFSSTANVYWNYDGAAVSIGDLPNRAFDSNEQYAHTDAALNLYNQTDTATPAADTLFAAIAAERIQANPLRYYLALPLARVVNMVFRPRVDNLPVPLDWWNFREHPRPTLFALAYGLLNLAYLTLAALGFSRRHAWGRFAPVLWAMTATLAMRSLLLLTLDNSEPRYTLEFYPVLIVLAASLWPSSPNQHPQNLLKRDRRPNSHPVSPAEPPR